MKAYKRILVPITSAGHGEMLLERAAEIMQGQRAQMMVVRILDTRSGIEPDGPAASLPGETAARRAPDARKHLELQLARMNLGWVEARVVWGEPKILLADLVRSWEPDLIVASSGGPAYGTMEGVDTLVVDCGGMFKRLSGMLHHPAPRHA